MEVPFWIIQVGLKCHHKCASKRQEGGDFTHTQGSDAEERCGHKPRNADSHQQKLGKAGGIDPPLEPLEGLWPLPTL